MADINLSKTNAKIEPKQEEIEAYNRTLAAVYDRGFTSARFLVGDAPAGMHYEWHPDDAETHYRLTQLGFVPDDSLAKKSNFVHTDGAGNPRIADVRLYTIPEWKKQMIDKAVEAQRVAKRNPQRAETELANQIAADDIGVGFNESTEKTLILERKE